ncbi:MAG: 3-deoxy-D-manno-octulosonic acid transferase [Candidatus Omnitrophica bacterium]|nr:3-deoxy-D-manno-octulosonic acid transferase [Candidatus Omnitrophota bacterium]
MFIIYDIFFVLYGLAYLVYIFMRKKAHKGFAQKFGALPSEVTSPGPGPVWIHAVSVGEANLAVKLAVGIKKRIPGTRIVISTTTPSGNILAKERGKGIADAVFYYPFDLSFIVSSVVRKIRPIVYIVVETEIWPNLLRALANKRVPVVLVNGRISGKSFPGYLRIRPLMRIILKNISLACMQSGMDAQRIKAIGMSPERVSVTGSIKFDISEPDGAPEFTKGDMGFGEHDPVIVAGSTHHPEEKFLADAFTSLRKKYEGLRLIIAPRHIERARTISASLHKERISNAMFSGIMKDRGKEVYDAVVVDTIGHLKFIYRYADVIFIGGSLMPHGGQNPIEGVAGGKPVIFGPSMYNFKEISEILIEAGAAIKVSDSNELTRVIDSLLADANKRAIMGSKGKEVVECNIGAMERTVEAVSQFMPTGAEA